MSGRGTGNEIPGARGGHGNAIPGGGTGTGDEIPGFGRGGAYVYGPIKHSGGGGFWGHFSFLHSVGHWIGSKSSLAGRDMLGMVETPYYLGKAGYSDFSHPSQLGHLEAGLAQGGGGDWWDARKQLDQSALGSMGTGMVRGTVQTVEHPLRDPFQTMLLAAPVLDLAGRVGEAGIAAKEGLASGEGGSFKGALQALRNHETPGPRELHVPGNDEPIYLHASRNAGVRLIQKAYDHVLQRALTKSSELEAGKFSDRVAGHAMRRAGGALMSASRITTRMREAAPFLLGKAAKQLGKLRLGDGTYPAEDVGDGALALVLENALPREAAVAHRAWAEGGLSPAENEAWAKFYDHLDSQNLLHRDPATGKVEINPQTSPELAHISELLKGVSADSERAIVDNGLMSEEGAAFRRNAPNLVRAGVHIPATMQRALRLAIQQRDALASALDHAHQLDENYQFNEGPKSVGGYPVQQGPFLTPGGASVEGHGLTPLESPMRDQIVQLQYRLQDAEDRLQKIAERAAKGSQRPEPIQRALLREIGKEVHGGDSVAANQELALLDRIAHQYAIENGVTPGQFYRDYMSEITRGLPGEGEVAAQDFLPQVKPFDETAAAEAAKRILSEIPKDKEGTLPERQTLPPGVKGVKTLVNLMRSLHGRASAAEFARLWYELRGKGFLGVSPDANAADQFGQLESIFSPRKDVEGSTGAAIQALNDHMVEGKVTHGFGPQQGHANALLDEGKPFTSSGQKTPSYRMNSLEEISPELYQEAGGTGREVTNDTWMRRAFKYAKSAKGEEPITDKQYNFMSAVEQHLADQLGWKPKHVQASVWTHIKAEVENGHEPTVEELQRAMQNPSDFFGKHSAQVYFEAEHPMLPPEAAQWSDATRQQYLHEKLSVIYDENGQNLILRELGLYGYRGSEGFGEWEGATTPSASTNVLSTRISTDRAGAEAPHQRPYEIDPNARQLVEEAAAAHGYVFDQDAAGYGQAFGGSALTRAKANAVVISRALSDTEMQALRAAGLHEDALILHAPGDRTIIKNLGDGPNQAFQDHVAEVVDRTLGPTDMKWAAHDGGLVEKENYDATLRAALGRRPDLGRALSDLRERARAVDRRFTQEEEAPAAGEHPLGAASGGHGLERGSGAAPDRLEPDLVFQHEGPTVHLANSRTTRGGYIEKPATFLRFGDLPEGASMNHFTGRNEAGVSTYYAWRDPKTGKYVLPSGSEQYLGTQSALAAERPIYEVTGTDTGHAGDDGEPLLETGSGKVVRRVHPDEVVNEQDPDLTLTGKELAPHETPDWHPLYQHEEPPRTAGEVAIRAMQQRGLKMLGAYDRTSGHTFIGHDAQPGTILHEALHASLESLPKILKDAVMAHYGEKELTPALHEKFVEDMSKREQNGAPLPPALEAVYEAMQHRPAEGTGYVPGYTHDEAGGTAPGPAQAMGTKVGGPRNPIRAGEYRGEALKHGARGVRTLNMISAHLRRINRYLETSSLRSIATRSVGSAVRRSERDILVRDFGSKIGAPGSTPKVSADVEALLGRRVKFQTLPAEQSVDTEAGALAGIQGFVQELFPGVEDKEAYKDIGVGTQAPEGYKWVDRGSVPNMSRVFSSSETNRFVRTVDAVNSAVTAATVYFKLGHIFTRVFTNAATNLMQGSITPLGLSRSVNLWNDLSTLDRWRAYGAVGTNYYEALPAMGETKLAGLARGGARFFGHYVDVPFRFNSLAYEFRRIGVNTSEEFTHALDAMEGKVDVPSAERAKYIQAAERADRESIAYDRMNEFEKRYLARVVWFYPWVKGSSMFTLRSIFEHSYKMAILGAGSKYAQEQQAKDFPGGVPSYEYGLVRLMAGKNPLVADFSTFSPTATLGQLLQAPEHTSELAGNLNPSLSALQTLITQRTPNGVGTNDPVGQALAQLISSTPEAQIVEQVSGHDSKMFPTHPAFPADFPGAAAFWRMLFGPAMPRHVSPAQLAKDMGLEKTGPR